MKRESFDKYDCQLPMIAERADMELSDLMDIVFGNVAASDSNNFRKAGVRVGHA